MSVKNKNKEIGSKGESMAVDYLVNKNYTILERNFRSNRNEIDIIALSPEGILVFAEVKTRTDTRFGPPEEAVDDFKEEMIQSCAESFILDKNWKGEIRFDIISITLNHPEPVFHMIDAF